MKQVIIKEELGGLESTHHIHIPVFISITGCRPNLGT